MIEPYWSDDAVTLHLGDCVEVMHSMPDGSVDAIVTDPPYGLEFMGQDWDRPWAVGMSAPGYSDGERLTRPAYGDNRNPTCATCGGRARGAKRCECPEPQWKPTGPRRGDTRQPGDETFHEGPGPFGRAKVRHGVGDAYGTSEVGRAFQAWCEAWAREALRVLKPGGHLLAFGGTRTWHRLACAVEDAGFEIRDSIHWIYAQGFPKSVNLGDGRGTALKPAHEPIILARKPVAGTVAANLAKHGTGALNIDACRVATADSLSGGAATHGSASHTEGWDRPWKNDPAAVAAHAERVAANVAHAEDLGRWPANIVFTHAPSCRPVGTRVVRSDSHHPASRGRGGVSTTGHGGQEGLTERASGVETVEAWECTPGCAVADLDAQSGVLTSGANPTRRGSDKFRDTYGDFAGQADCYAPRGTDTGGASRFFPAFKYEAKAGQDERPRLADGTSHPTVKPVDLMRWLVKLITPPGGLVLDCFAGSGTTGEACVIDAFRCVLIERDPQYAELIKARLRKPIALDLFGGVA